MACLGVKGLKASSWNNIHVWWRVDIFRINAQTPNPQHYRWHIYHRVQEWSWLT